MHIVKFLVTVQVFVVQASAVRPKGAYPLAHGPQMRPQLGARWRPRLAQWLDRALGLRHVDLGQYLDG
jgi:hypothetical protein